jgi:hypothetical protein
LKKLTKPDVVDMLFFRSKKECIDAAESGRFDIIIIDAEPRIDAARVTQRLLKENGIIIVDNSDIRRLSPILHILRSNGFKRINFYGYSPLLYFLQAMYIIFFKTTSFWNTKEDGLACSPLSFRN